MKLGPLASMETWASVRGTADRFFTHLSNCADVVVVSADADNVIGEVDASDVIAVVDVVLTDVVAVTVVGAIHV